MTEQKQVKKGGGLDYAIKETENIENPENLELNVWEKHGEKRLYINGWIGKRNKNPYVDLKEMKSGYSSIDVNSEGNKMIVKREKGWDGYKTEEKIVIERR